MLTHRIQILLIAALLLAPEWSSAALAESPKTFFKRTNNRISKLLRTKAPKGSAKDKKIQEQLSQEVNAFINFPELAKRSLHQHWDKRTPAQQEEFVNLLRDLIENNYLKQLRKNLKYKLKVGAEKLRGATASVMTTVEVKKKRRVEEVTIEYRMQRVKGRWMVYDVVTDDVSIVKNYRAQFNRIIKRNSYEHLLKKMRRKLAKAKKKDKKKDK
jgi:phospholipid transport system substrate-binding protein